jgi:hypothetical protein
MTGTSLEQLRRELLARPAVREAYEKQALEYAIAVANRVEFPTWI